jgi:hypothetical protein
MTKQTKTTKNETAKPAPAKPETKTAENGTRVGLPKLRVAALKALKVDAFNAEILRFIAKTGTLPTAKRATA